MKHTGFRSVQKALAKTSEPRLAVAPKEQPKPSRKLLPGMRKACK